MSAAVLEAIAPGLQVSDKEVNKRNNSVFAHTHAVSSVTRGLFEDELYDLLRERYPSAWVVLGGSRREKRKLRPQDHVCASVKCCHDVTHGVGDHDMETCSVQTELLVSTDMLYYQDPQQIAGLLRQHGASAYVASICVPYIGGGGDVYGTEGRWSRTGPSTVRVTSDLVTMETWEHSDMQWLLVSACRAVDHGEFLVWTPVRGGGGRVAYEFRLSAVQVETPIQDIPTLDGWIMGGPAPPAKYAYYRVAYESWQVYKALGQHHYDVGTDLVFVEDVKHLSNWLQQNPQKRPLWRELAAQRSRGMNVAAVAATCELAIFFAEQAEVTRGRKDWYWATAERFRRWKASLHYATSWLNPPNPGQVNWRVLATWIESPHLFRAVPVSGVQYTGYDILTTCVPTVGTYETPRGKMVVDDCHCQPKVAYRLAGIAIEPEFVAAPCCCPKMLGTAIARRVLDVELPEYAELDGALMEGVAGEVDMEMLEEFADDLIERLRLLTGVSSGHLGSRRPSFHEWVQRDKFSPLSRGKLRHARAAGANTSVGSAAAFVKNELYCKPPECDGLDAEAFKPRCIQPIEFERRAVIGPGIYGATHAIKAVFGRDSSVWFTSGATAEQLGSWFDESTMSINGIVAYIRADYGTFDGTNFISVGQKVAAGVKLLVGVPPSQLAYDFKRRGGLKTTFGHTSKYGGAGLLLTQNRATVTSGHDDTTCGNTTVNAVIHAQVQNWQFRDSVKYKSAVYEPPHNWVEHDVLNEPDCWGIDAMATVLGSSEGPTDKFFVRSTPKASAVVMGDDGGVILALEHAEEYTRLFQLSSRRLGFKPEAAYSTEAYEFEFCSFLAWPSEDGTVFGPKIGRILMRTGFKTGPGNTAKVAISQLRGDALGLMATVHHVPILRAWVAKILQLTSISKVQKLSEPDAIRATGTHEANSETWVFASQRYGLSVSVLEELERQVTQVTRLPAILRHPAWSVIARRDA